MNKKEVCKPTFTPNSLHRKVFKITKDIDVIGFTCKVGDVISYAIGENSFLIISRESEQIFSNTPINFKGKDGVKRCEEFFEKLKLDNKK